MQQPIRKEKEVIVIKNGNKEGGGEIVTIQPRKKIKLLRYL